MSSGEVFTMLSQILLTLLYFSGTFSATLGPCKKEDQDCLSESLSKSFSKMIVGVASRGVHTSDPMFHKVIEGEIPPLKYKFTNTTVRGFRNCILKNAKLNLDTLKFYYEIECPSIHMSGDYELNGVLLSIPVNGKGTYDLITSAYWGAVDMDLEKIERDGKTYLKMNDFKAQVEARGPVQFDFKNLFNGNKVLSDAIHKFAHESWKEVTDLFNQPVFSENVKYLTKNYNDYLKFEPLEEIFVDL